MRLEIFFGSVAAAGAVIVVAQLNAGGDVDSSIEQDTETVPNLVREGGMPAGAIGPDVIYTNCQGVTN